MAVRKARRRVLIILTDCAESILEAERRLRSHRGRAPPAAAAAAAAAGIVQPVGEFQQSSHKKFL